MCLRNRRLRYLRTWEPRSEGHDLYRQADKGCQDTDESLLCVRPTSDPAGMSGSLLPRTKEAPPPALIRFDRAVDSSAPSMVDVRRKSRRTIRSGQLRAARLGASGQRGWPLLDVLSVQARRAAPPMRRMEYGGLRT